MASLISSQFLLLCFRDQTCLMIRRQRAKPVLCLPEKRHFANFFKNCLLDLLGSHIFFCYRLCLHLNPPHSSSILPGKVYQKARYKGSDLSVSSETLLRHSYSLADVLVWQLGDTTGNEVFCSFGIHRNFLLGKTKYWWYLGCYRYSAIVLFLTSFRRQHWIIFSSPSG